jgi:hypothetical protein
VTVAAFDGGDRGIEVQNGAFLMVRGTTFDVSEGAGLVIEQGDAAVDLGNPSTDGQNVFRLDPTRFAIGVDLFPAQPPYSISATNNTWAPRLQGADDAGKYQPGTLGSTFSCTATRCNYRGARDAGGAGAVEIRF